MSTASMGYVNQNRNVLSLPKEKCPLLAIFDYRDPFLIGGASFA